MYALSQYVLEARARLLPAALLVILIFMPSVKPAAAQGISDDWTPIGPYGGTAGRIIVHPDDPSQLYAPAYRLFYSSDSGESWQATGPSGHITDALIEEGEARRILLAIDGRVMAGDGPGGSWQLLSQDLAGIGISGFASSPDDPSRLYAYSSRQVYRSDDGGQSWRAVGTDHFFIGDVVASPLDANLLYSITSRSLMRSTDGGETWREIDRETGVSAQVIASPFDRETIYLSRWREHGKISTDAGLTWRTVDVEAGNFALDTTDAQTLYLYDYTIGNQLLRSTNGGETWQAVPSDLPPQANIERLTIAPTTPGVFYAGVSDLRNPTTLYKSVDGGATWEPISQGINALGVSAFAYSADRTRLYAAASSSLYRRDRENGEAAGWERALLPADAYYANGLAVHPTETETLFLQSEPGIYRTTDGGATWQSIWETGETYAIALHLIPATPPTLALADSRGKVWISINNGDTWQETLDINHPAGIPLCGRSFSFAHHPQSPDIVYFFADNIVYRSEDAGATWQAVHEFAVPVVDPPIYWCNAPLAVNDDGAVWLGGINIILRSRDQGETWEGVADELFDPAGRQESILEIDFAPGRPTRVAVRTYSRILFSQSDGARWVVAYGAGDGVATYPGEIDLAPGDEVMLTAALGGFGIFTRTLEIEEWLLPVMRK
ncbi:MAG: hypothetical protein H6642_12625 [Caldilineaceae bacterium]|nr:hypothetical protein [Caldilineaceae bacterium]